ncbi:MAG: hypothetical protein HY017_11010 [Betaproteobacteria bacterium]|nr:hypothetical protein [Betaproteobacteria bacterium]
MAEPMPDPFETFRKLWGPLGMPVPGMSMPTLDPAEIEKRVNELKSVEAWLSLNLNMVKLSIQGLEVQRAALLAMKSATDSTVAAMQRASESTPGPAPDPAAPNAMAATNAMLWPWAAMQAAAGKKEGGGGAGKG